MHTILEMEEDFRVLALGGLGEVGSNCYLFEGKKEIIIVDCGTKFINNETLVSGSVPNFSYLLSRIQKIKALFVSHAHDDHIAGISFLLEQIPEIPIYGSEFTVSLAKQKTKISSKKKWNIFHEETVITTGEFQVSFFRVTHSIPGSFGLFIEFLPSLVKIVFTGDFKFDWTQIGEKFDIKKLTKLCSKGVDLLLSESTNAEIEGSTPSETLVIKRLENIILSAPGRVIITSFSSNVYRLKKVMEIAKKTNRFIVILGSSLLRAMKAIRSVSLWELDSSVFLKSSNVVKTSPNKVIIFCTGSQGEERSVLNRLADNVYPGWKFEDKDSVIWTSSPIMDNKTNVEFINNKLFSKGVRIFENSPDDVLHSSGHACQEDLKLLLTLVSPRFFPYHGDYYILKKHSQLAQGVGIPKKNIFVCQNGDIVSYKENNFYLSEEKANTEKVYIFNQKIISSEKLKSSLGLRSLMSEGGVVLIVLFYTGEIFELPYIFTYGFLKMQKNKKIVDWWKNSIKEFLFEKCFENVNLNVLVADYFINILLKNWIGSKPVVRVIKTSFK